MRHFIETGADTFSGARGADTDAVGILYTSGSTGEPKGVVLSHRNFVARARCVSEYLNLTSDDRILNLPHYSFGFGLDQLFNSFYVGACSVLHNYVTPQALMNVLVSESVTGVAAVPTALIALTALDWPQEARQSVRYIAAAGGRMPESATYALRCLAPDAEIYLMYGQTETLRSTFLPPGEIDRRPNSIGKAISVAKIYVVRPDGTLCDPNEQGELVQTGDTVALGYWNDPERTAQIFRPAPAMSEGNAEPEIAVWSGDIVTYDEDGFLYYVGRRDDLIKSSGYRISPSEIEDVISASGLVESAAVVGIKNAEEAHDIVAFVTTRENAELNRDALNEYCRRNLPNYMVPHQTVQRDSLPLNANSKIDRRRLVSDYLEQEDHAPAERTRARRAEPDGGFAARAMAPVLELVGLRRRSVASVREIFASAFNMNAIDESLSFSSLGGDSLSYVDVSTALEDFIGHVPENWENVPIRDLEKMQRSSATSTTITPDILLRVAAILGVVGLHNRYTSLAGGVYLLFELSGLSFARFGWSSDPAMVRRTIFGTMMRIVVPTMLLLLTFFLGDGIIHWSVILFVDNLLAPDSPLWWEGAWFVQCLFQIFLFVGILASIPGVGSFGQKHRYAFGLLFTISALLLHYGLAMTVHSPILSYGRLPQYFLWQFGLGWLVFASRSQIQRVVTLATVFGCLALLFTIRNKTGDDTFGSHARYWLVFGTALLLWMPAISVPRLVAAPLVTIAKSTLFIYLFHWPFDVLAYRWLHINGGPVGIVIGLSGGVGVWLLYETLGTAIRSIRGTVPQTADVLE